MVRDDTALNGKLYVYPALAVENLSITVGGRRLIHDLTFRAEPGERVALLGASGSGKSLTASAVLGSLGPEFAVTGSISLFGSSRVSSGAGRRGKKIAAVYQDSLAALNPLVTVGDQLIATLRAQVGSGISSSRRELTVTVVRMLESVGIEDAQRTMWGFPAELSGGQRQRVCIALALLCNARLLVADEPTTALDVVNQSKVIDVLRTYADTSSSTLVFITHDLAVAASLCDRAIVLEAGRIVETGTMYNLIARPLHRYTRALVDAAAPALMAGDRA